MGVIVWVYANLFIMICIGEIFLYKNLIKKKHLYMSLIIKIMYLIVIIKYIFMILIEGIVNRWEIIKY